MSDISRFLSVTVKHFVFAMLVFASILALAVGMERAIVFRKNSNKKISRFAAELIALLRKRDLKAAAELVRESGDNVYTRFARFLDRPRQGQRRRASRPAWREKSSRKRCILRNGSPC